MKNDMPSDYANYHYKVRGEEVPFSALLVSFKALKEGTYDDLVSSKS